MSTRFTFPLFIIFAIIAIVFCEIKVTEDNYKNVWKCNSVCRAYNMGYQFAYIPEQACSTLSGTPSGCPKKSIKLYKKGTFGIKSGFFEEHSLLECVSNGAIVGYLTSGRVADEYLTWQDNNNDGKFYPGNFVKYPPEE